ncbi:hypothetical protein [Paenibacillus sp. SI8]|uniref:hypothetical protein n=1 Tax=unclassified Paenibacillus TaxID=185978 RepID=UPI00346658D0
MEPEGDKKREHREITYQVGWKKGKIEWNEGISSPLHVHSLNQADGETLNGQRWLRLLWHAVPALPGALLLPLLYALPVVLFILTIVLVYSLRL